MTTKKKDEALSESAKRRAEQEKNGAKPYDDANLKSAVNPYNVEGHADTAEGEKGQ